MNQLLLGLGYVTLPIWMLFDVASFSSTVDSACGNLRPGMTRAEVSAVLGCIPGDHSPGAQPDRAFGGMTQVFGEFEDCHELAHRDTWFGKNVAILVTFDDEGQAIAAFERCIWRPYDSYQHMLLCGLMWLAPNPQPASSGSLCP